MLWCCWLGVKKGIRPVKNWVVVCWHGCLYGVRCRFAYGPADATATHCLLLQQNPDLVLPFWYRLTRVVPDKGPLSVCVCVCGWVRACVIAAEGYHDPSDLCVLCLSSGSEGWFQRGFYSARVSCVVVVRTGLWHGIDCRLTFDTWWSCSFSRFLWPL